MNRLSNLVMAAGVGAGLVYFLDPVAGRRRRAQIRDRLIQIAKQTRQDADATVRDVRNRAYGTYAELRSDARDAAEAATGRSR